jgi:TatD DNase family protein
MLVDSHCHIDYLTGPRHGMRVEDVLQSATDAGVSHLLSVAVDRENIPRVLAHAMHYDNVFASVGVHPMSCHEATLGEDELVELAKNPKVVAIGETGLDYYYSRDHAELQRECFVTHLRAAKRAGLPVIVHSREAREDTLRLLREHADRHNAGVMHCFTETLEMARAAIEFDFLISFSGIITFRNAEALRAVVRELPLESLLVETDSPYLAPVPHRGKVNEPRHVVHVAAAVAAIKGVSVQAVEEATTDNFFRLFRRATPVPR